MIFLDYVDLHAGDVLWNVIKPLYVRFLLVLKPCPDVVFRLLMSHYEIGECWFGDLNEFPIFGFAHNGIFSHTLFNNIFFTKHLPNRNACNLENKNKNLLKNELFKQKTNLWGTWNKILESELENILINYRSFSFLRLIKLRLQ